MRALTKTNYNFPQQKSIYHGKVRDVYNIANKYLVMVATDRISAFDVILPKGIPYKGQVLNGVATMFMEATKNLVPNWILAVPHPNVAIGLLCEPIRIEMVIRGYLTGHAWREYNEGKRMICGVALPEGMKENEKFANPIITPATKAEQGHDVDISRADIIKSNIVTKEIYDLLELYTQKLFEEGTNFAAKKGLILVDTKYEFGILNNEIILIDEIHTPDSSRYFYIDGYEERQSLGFDQIQLSKEFVRQWLIENGFSGKEGQHIPEMTEEWVNQISDRYIELHDAITGIPFVKKSVEMLQFDIEKAVMGFLKEKGIE
jgi:phosphoribosylaminoimidazole-succinocarboxamide synthase